MSAILSQGEATGHNFDAFRREVNARFDGVDARFDGVETRITSLEGEVRGLKDEVHELKDWTHRVDQRFDAIAQAARLSGF